jgi:hypothetical protein
MPGRVLCERHGSDNPARFRPRAKPTIDGAAALLASTSKAKRKRGMEMLCELHARELILQHALQERDAAVLGVVAQELDHHPPELVRHLLTQPSAYDANLYMRFHIARGNHLYVEETIRAVYFERRTLTLDAIEAIGRAYLRSLSDLLHKYLSGTLDLYEDALRFQGPKAVAGVEGVAKNGWSRKGWAAVLSAISLARLDAEFDLREIERLLAAAERIQSELPRREFWADEVRGRIHRTILGTQAHLEWILFEKGLRPTAEKVIGLVRRGTIEILPDLATTLLKRKEEDSLRELVREFSTTFFVAADFCFWPLMNWLESSGFLGRNEFGVSEQGREGTLTSFWRAREQRIEPPAWWQWR